MGRVAAVDYTASERNRFAGKSVLITGGAGGIGLAAARQFAREGANISILDIQDEAGAQLTAELSELGVKSFYHHTDVSKPDQVRTAIAEVVEEVGHINVLFNHAGTIIVKPFHETTNNDYDFLMDVNLRSAFTVGREVVTHMVAAGGGAIVFTASIGSARAFVYESLYCITKAAVLMLSNAIAVEYRDHGIRSNAVCPGFVKTDHGLREIAELDALGQEWQEADLQTSQVRLCNPEEVAAAALFLASDDASFINGASIHVDNGWLVKG